MAFTEIQWTWRKIPLPDGNIAVIKGYTYNPWWSCIKVSEECKHCYAEDIAHHYDYFLFFATNSQKGLLEMKRAMWGVDLTGTFEFSDFSNPYQPLLLSEPNYTDLQQRLSKEFQGKTVPIEVVEEYVLAETPYLTCKKVVLAPMEAASPPQIHVQVTDPSYKRKKGDYPAGKTLIKFPQTVVRAQTLF